MSDPEIATLRDRLARLEDLEAARGLLHAYATVLDDPDEDTVAALFAEEGVLTNARGTYRGRDEVAKGFRIAFDADPSRKRHFIATPKLTWVEPGVVESQAVFFFVGQAAGQSVLGWGAYDDRIAVAGGRALFLAKTITTHLRTDLATGWAR
jgi:3-phenylpropionate/cinnamic acid dioxygenase small subunit